jgi:Ran GTPase-activating protein (RanGAP) involved in mRNA processing and transport
MSPGESDAFVSLLSACTSLHTLSIRHCYVNEAILTQIQRITSLTHLDMYGCTSSHMGEAAMALLTHHTKLSWLNVSCMTLGDSVLNSIGQSLAQNSSLQTLHLGTVFTDGNPSNVWPNPEVFASGLMRNSTLRELYLSNNMGAGGARALVDALAHNTILELLSVVLCNIGNDGANIFAGFLETNTCLKALILTDNAIVSGGCVPVAAAMSRNTTLQHLSLCCNTLSHKDAEAIAHHCMTLNTTLQKLELSNTMSLRRHRNLQPIFDALAYNASLMHLDISNNQISDQDSRALGMALTTNTTLTHLNISDHRLTSEAFVSLCKGLTVNTGVRVLITCDSIETMDIDSDDQDKYQLKPECDEAMYDLVSKNTTLQCLCLGDVSANVCVSLLLALQNNCTLQSVCFTQLADSEIFDIEDQINVYMAIAYALRVNPYIREIATMVQYLEGYQDELLPQALAIGKALVQNPRYNTLRMHGFPLGTVAKQLGMPRMDMCSNRWPDEDLLTYIQALHFDKILAFIMGVHVRLGSKSCVQPLNPDLIRTVALYYFCLPVNYFDSAHATAAEFTSVTQILDGF